MIGGRPVAFVATLLAATSAGGAQDGRGQRTPTFGSAVEVVRLDVSVLDRANRFVVDLRQEDFEVLEDGEPQSLTLFVQRELPLSLVLVLDASSSIANRLSLAKIAAIGFLGNLRAGDEASVVTFADSVVVQGPTGDHEVLRRAIDGIVAGGNTALHNALYVVLRRLPSARRDAELRRRAIVLLSDGADTASLVWEEQVVELARRRGATIHVIDLRRGGAAGDRSERLLRTLARESGGEVHRPASIGDLDAVYARIGEELRSQYSLGYVSSNPGHSGRWRRMEVRVRARRDVTTRHRTGYYDVP